MTSPARTFDERLAIFKQWQPLAYKLAYRAAKSTRLAAALKCHGFTKDDVIQVALLAAWKATDLWDPAKGAFGTMLSMRFPQEMILALKLYRNAAPGLDIDYRGNGRMIDVAGPGSDVLDAVHMKLLGEVVRVELDKLTPYMRDLVTRHAAGRQIKDLALDHGTHYEATRRAYHTGIGRLRGGLESRFPSLADGV